MVEELQGEVIVAEGGPTEVETPPVAQAEPVEVEAPKYLTQEDLQKELAQVRGWLKEVQSASAKGTNVSQAALNEITMLKQQIQGLVFMQGQQIEQQVENAPPEEQAAYWKARAKIVQPPAPQPAQQMDKQQAIEYTKREYGTDLKEAYPELDLEDPGIDWAVDAKTAGEAFRRMHTSAAKAAKVKQEPSKTKIAPPPVEVSAPMRSSGSWEKALDAYIAGEKTTGEMKELAKKYGKTF